MKKRAFAGLDVVVENEVGSVRQWRDRDARLTGETRMQHDYGFLEGHQGSDGDEVDVYLGPDENAPNVHVVHQLKAPEYKQHDEDKVMLGFADEASARSAYLAHRNDGERAYGGMTSMPMERFKAKLSRRTGDGKIRHEMNTPFVKFDVLRDEGGKVRVNVWDRVCVPGSDEKDGQSTEFTVETLSQMVDNLVERGDPIPIDYNHQSNYAHINGRPAPALGFYGALAVVWDGKVVKHGGVGAYDSVDIDLSRDGLWAFRTEVTELGDELLPNFKLLSPTFQPKGTRRDGSKCGYVLAAVAATNTPWQGGTQITFAQGDEGRFKVGDKVKIPSLDGERPDVGTVVDKYKGMYRWAYHIKGSRGANYNVDDADTSFVKMDSVGAVPTASDNRTKEKKKMAKLANLAKFAGVAADADDTAIKAGIAVKMEDTAMAAASDEAFDYAGMAGALSDAAQKYEDAHMEDDDGTPPHQTMRKMAAKFRKLGMPVGETAAMAADPGEDKDKKDEEKKMADDKDKADGEAKFATVIASNQAMAQRLAALEAEKADREKAEQAKRAREFEQLADRAIAGGYPKGARAALVKFASVDFAGAQESVAHFLPKIGAPVALFDRLSQAGGPVGQSGNREMPAAASKRVVSSMGRKFIEDDAGRAEEIRRIAESKDPVTMAKVDKLLGESQRSVLFNRLLAADKIVTAERPDLAEVAE